MKRILILFLALITAVSTAAVPYHRPMKPLPKRMRPVRVIPWKTILAGGAATGTVIAAYKVSNGVEEGMKIAAKEKPEAFTDSLSVLTWPIRMAAFTLFLISGCWIWKKWLEHETTTPKGNETWTSH